MGRILVVDDEVNVLKTYQRIFLDGGHEILCVASGEEALREAPGFGPDIILLDIMMPGMDGYEVCEQLKAAEQTKEAEVIFVSAKGETADRLRGYHVRSSDFLVKPFDPEELQAKIAVILGRKRYYLDLASIDELTQLGNRRFFNGKFNDIFEVARRCGRVFSLAIIDIDHFKMVNDTYGHQTGDCILTELACRLKESLRAVDIVARIGGEEFAVLIPETENQRAAMVLERLRAKIASQAFVKPMDGHRVNITISAAVASYPDDAVDKESLFKRADEALYLAKEMGRNRVVATGNIS